jgi:CheY-like chemotaxis protein
LALVVAESVTLFEPAAREKGLALRLRIEEAARRRVTGDPARLRQILTSLLSNAFKFTRDGAIDVIVAVLPSGDYRIEVSDTGVGFDAKDAKRLFGRFEQGDASMTREFGGAGLGLALCRELCGLMGGAISAASDLGRGSTFTVTLPLPIADDQAPNEVPQDIPESEGGAPLRVLVTDDNATNRRVAELILQTIGAEMVFAENGLEAVQAVERVAFDVVLMDLQMPVMDGLTAIRAIRAREASERLPRLPIVVVSANAMPEQVAASRDAGADGHLGKPIRAETLIEAVANALEPQTQSPQSAVG